MRNLLIVILLFFCLKFYSQSIFTPADVEICNSKFELAIENKLTSKPIGDVIVDIGKSFLGVDYEAFTLEKGDREQLVIHLSGLDCYTFFESSLVLARCIKLGKTSFEDFQDELLKVRYRDGELNGYTSRLHYSSDWLSNNAKRGIVQDVTKQVGGIVYTKKIDFMTSHSSSYKMLKNNAANVEMMKKIEDEINKRTMYYIPENFIESVEDSIKSGDIILITASVKGLDISHTGIAVKLDDGRIHFMHAPLKGKKVQITKLPLADYIKALDSHTGIMVARALDPN